MVVAALSQISWPTGSRVRCRVRSVLTKRSWAGLATAEMPLAESATATRRSIGSGCSPSTRPTVRWVHTDAGPGASNDPATQRHATASRYPACHPAGRTIGSTSSCHWGAGLAGVGGRSAIGCSSWRSNHARAVMTGCSGRSAVANVASARAIRRPGRSTRAVSTSSATGTGPRMSKVRRAGSARSGRPPSLRTARVSSAEGGPACCWPGAHGPVVCADEWTRALRLLDPDTDSSRRR